MPRNQTVGAYAKSLFCFPRTFSLFSKVAVPLCIPVGDA